MTTLDDSLYFAEFGLRAVKGLLRPHRLKIPATEIRHKRNFYFTRTTEESWNVLFGIPPETVGVPFSFYWRLAETCFLKVLGQLGLNFRYVLHLSSERGFPNPMRKPEAGKVYVLESAVKDLCPLDRDRICVVTETSLRSPDGDVVQYGYDYIFVRSIDKKGLETLKADQRFNRHPVNHLYSIKKKTSELSETFPSKRLFVSEDMGRRFGVIAGDLNPIHINKPMARLFGQKDAFLQGEAVSNYLLRFFSFDLSEKIKEFQVSFSKPVYMGQNMVVRYDKESFECLDRAGQLTCFGVRKHHEV